MRTYHQLCPEDECGGPRRRGTSQTYLTYIDTVISKSVVEHLVIGDMLNEKAFYEFAATGKGGKMSDEAMRARWVELIAETNRGERLFDHEGPNGCLQIWVKTGKQVNFVESLEKQRGYQALLLDLRPP